MSKPAPGLETFIDAFAGIEGFGIAAERNGLKSVGAIEYDKYCRQIYKKHHGHEPAFGDITKVDAKEIPDHDIFFGGFPCPAFSIAGKRKGFRDPRGSLFFEICRIAEAKRPNYMLLENVKGLLSAPYVDEEGNAVPDSNGWCFHTILATLGNMGYNVQWQLLYSRRWVPQDRQRVYILCSRRGIPIPEVFPLEDYAGEVESDKGGESRAIGRVHKHQGGRVYGPGSVMPTLTAGDKGPFYDGGHGLRILSPVERERLQGFPDGWTEGVSDSQRMKQCGNAITVQAAEAVIRQLVACHNNGGPRPGHKPI